MSSPDEPTLEGLIDIGDPPLPQRSSSLTDSKSPRFGRGCGFVAVGVLFGILAAVLYAQGYWILGTLVALFALFFLAAAFAGPPRVAACPFCSYLISVDDEKSSRPLQCSRCFEYSSMQEGELRALDPDSVSETQEFEVPLFMDARWPRACIVCGAEPTRVDDLSRLNVAASHLILGRLTLQQARVVGIPYCEAHKDGLKVKTRDREVLLRWRSLRMMRRYLAANRQAASSGV
jgi:hypothetical protein